MIDQILEELNELNIDKKLRYKYNKENILIVYLIHLKYLCDTNVYQYDEVLLNDELYELNREIKHLKWELGSSKLQVNRILLKLKNYPLKDLLFEFLNFVKKTIYFHDDKEKIAYLNIEDDLFSFYNPKGNSTYIMKRPEAFEIFQVFDEILNVKNNYIAIDEVTNECYDYVYFYNKLMGSSKHLCTTLEEVRTLLSNHKNIILITKYNKISNFREGRFLVRYIKTIILDHNDAIIHFQRGKDNYEITIINTDKIKDQNKLSNIIKNNRKQKDILIKTTLNDIRDNNYRIGFHLYQLEKTSSIKDINKIVDENTKYLEKINIINERIERRINRLLNL